jgi:hypothetical protein
MRKHYSSDLIPSKTPDIQCDHNAFAHQIFPRLIQRQGPTIIDALTANPYSAHDVLSWALNITHEAAPPEPDRQTLSLSHISVASETENGRRVVTLTLSKPNETIGAYFIGLLTLQAFPSSDEERHRYFTLERNTPRLTALCEWTPDENENLVHCYLRRGPKPQIPLFHRAIWDLLAFEHVFSRA